MPNCICGRPATVIASGYPWCPTCWRTLDQTVEDIGKYLNLQRKEPSNG